jgi:hypothetical protein
MNIIEQSRTIYFSKKNSDYIRDYIFNKYNVENLETSIDNTIEKSLESILTTIFDSYQQTITTEFIQKKGKIDHENILVQLNKMAMIKLESILQQLISQKNAQKNTQNDQSNLQTQSVEMSKNIEKSIQTEIIISNTKFSQTEISEEGKIFKELINVQIENTQKATHFYSDDVKYITEDGVFVFEIPFSNVSNVVLKSLRIKADLYNVQINNNYFTLIENGETKKISIPIGYYNIKNLVKEINKLLQDMKSNCNLVQSDIKNRIYIENNSSKYKTFDIIFPDIQMITIGEMLGFSEKEYRNNNIYIAENLPDIELFNDIYLRMFVNNTELNRIKTTKENFTYFTLLSAKNTLFYSDTECKYSIPKTNIHNVSFQLLCNPYIPLTSNIYFEIILFFN